MARHSAPLPFVNLMGLFLFGSQLAEVPCYFGVMSQGIYFVLF
jgi:hypothetical protein